MRELAVTRGINAIESGPAYRHGGRLRVERAAMGRAIDAKRKAAGDDEPCARQCVGELPRIFQSRRRWVARTDDSQLRTRKTRAIADNIQRQRRIRYFAQQRGVI